MCAATATERPGRTPVAIPSISVSEVFTSCTRIILRLLRDYLSFLIRVCVR
jgi:hypothetical protein